MNIVLDEAIEEKAGGEKVSAGMVVSVCTCCFIRCGWRADGLWFISGHSGQLYNHAGGTYSIAMLRENERAN